MYHLSGIIFCIYCAVYGPRARLIAICEYYVVPMMPSARTRCPRDARSHPGWGVSSSKHEHMNCNVPFVRYFPSTLLAVGDRMHIHTVTYTCFSGYASGILMTNDIIEIFIVLC